MTQTQSTSAFHQNPQLPGVPLEQWAHDVLAGLGLPTSSININTLMRWATKESGGGSATSCAGRWNPLNTTESHVGYACQGGSQGNIKGFSSYQQGVQAIVWNLSHTRGVGYEAILDGLRAENQDATLNAVSNSAFGTHPPYPVIDGVGGPIDPSGGTPTGTGGTSSGAGTGNDSVTADDDQCLVKLPGTDIGPITLGGNCLVRRSQGRAILGATMLLLGGTLLLVGVALIGIGSRPARQALNLVPGVRA